MGFALNPENQMNDEAHALKKTKQEEEVLLLSANTTL